MVVLLVDKALHHGQGHVKNWSGAHVQSVSQLDK
jgi:hypothetical protein